MKQANEKAIMAVGFELGQVLSRLYLNLRYARTNTSIMIEGPLEQEGIQIEELYSQAFERQH